jgi:hypothetical protein
MSTLRRRRAPGPNPPAVELLRDPVSNRFLFGSTPASTRTLYVDIAKMGHTDFSLWFEDDHGDRTEICLDRFGREEIARLHDTIVPSWQRARDGVDADLETSRRTAQQVRELTGTA